MKMHKSELLSSNTNNLYNSDRVPLIHLDQLPKILICKCNNNNLWLLDVTSGRFKCLLIMLFVIDHFFFWWHFHNHCFVIQHFDLRSNWLVFFFPRAHDHFIYEHLKDNAFDIFDEYQTMILISHGLTAYPFGYKLTTYFMEDHIAYCRFGWNWCIKYTTCPEFNTAFMNRAEEFFRQYFSGMEVN